MKEIGSDQGLSDKGGSKKKPECNVEEYVLIPQQEVTAFSLEMVKFSVSQRSL